MNSSPPSEFSRRTETILVGGRRRDLARGVDRAAHGSYPAAVGATPGGGAPYPPAPLPRRPADVSAWLLHQQLTSQIQELDAKKENLIDLAADGTLPQTKVKAKLRDIDTRRRRLTARLDNTSTDLTDSARLIDTSRTVLQDAEALYRRCNDQQRRQLNRAIFRGLYAEDEEITDHDLHEPFALRQTKEHSTEATRSADGLCSKSSVAILLQGLNAGQGSQLEPLGPRCRP